MSDGRRVTFLVCEYHTGQTGAHGSRKRITSTGAERALRGKSPIYPSISAHGPFSITRLTPSSPQTLPIADSVRG
jgi:hypothetical protein